MEPRSEKDYDAARRAPRLYSAMKVRMRASVRVVTSPPARRRATRCELPAAAFLFLALPFLGSFMRGTCGICRIYSASFALRMVPSCGICRIAVSSDRALINANHIRNCAV
jgi:hypothetical protein